MSGYLLFALIFWLSAWGANEWLVRQHFAALAQRAANIAVPLLFGITLLVIWECVVRGFDIPPFCCPPPA